MVQLGSVKRAVRTDQYHHGKAGVFQWALRTEYWSPPRWPRTSRRIWDGGASEAGAASAEPSELEGSCMPPSSARVAGPSLYHETRIYRSGVADHANKTRLRQGVGYAYRSPIACIQSQLFLITLAQSRPWSYSEHASPTALEFRHQPQNQCQEPTLLSYRKPSSSLDGSLTWPSM